MVKKEKKWEILNESNGKNLIDILLENRGLITKKQKDDFLNPIDPLNIKIQELGISEKSLKISIERIEAAIKKNEQIVIYGDYDADGICATAILWETLYAITKNVTPHIPDRFLEGYGINPKSIEKIRSEKPNVKLIITVDNGIVAFDGIKKANDLGIDVIVTDHHQKDSKVPRAYSVLHTTKIAGSGVAWFFSREIKKRIKNTIGSLTGLELAAIGTIADQLPLTDLNRSIAKFGLKALNQTKRSGLLALFEEAGIKQGLDRGGTKSEVGTYEVNYLIAPRLNAMGRLEHAIDSLRLLCTNDKQKAAELAIYIGNVNKQRQKVVEEVLSKARTEAAGQPSKSAIVISGNYHEGVIGLAAGKLVEEFDRPAIVFSEGEEYSKGSARSIPDYNIIDEIKKLKSLLIGAGGHPMAAGLSIKTKDMDKFKRSFQKNSTKLLKVGLLTKTLKVDTTIKFDQINYELISLLDDLKPYGMGNPYPAFFSDKVTIVSSKVIGSDKKHLKLLLQSGGNKFDSIAFNFGYLATELAPKSEIAVVFGIEENIWNGNRSLQLKVKDLKLTKHD